jgi:putative ABC transport system substrate-binding protein
VTGRAKPLTRKITALAAGALVLALFGPADAQQTGKIFRIGYLDVSTPSGSAILVDALRQELSKLGWVEGKNIAIEYRFAEQKQERLPELAADLVRLKVDVLVTTGGGPASSAKEVSGTIPIVVTAASELLASGLVASLARPAGNVTGLSVMTAELSTKRLEILKDAIPKLSSVGFLRDTQKTKTNTLELKELKAAASALNLKLEDIEAETDAKGIESALQTAKQKQLGAIMTASSRYFLAEKKRIVELANKNRLAAMYHQKEYVDQGGLMSYGVDYVDLYRRAAVYVDKILKGAKPGELPIQQATKFEFVINLKAAKQIGLTIPVRVLERANQVIK